MHASDLGDFLTGEHPQLHLLEAAHETLAGLTLNLTALGWLVDDDISTGLTLTEVKLRKNGKQFVATHISLQWRPVVAGQVDFNADDVVILPIWAIKPWLLTLPDGKTLSFLHFDKALASFLAAAARYAPPSNVAPQQKA